MSIALLKDQERERETMESGYHFFHPARKSFWLVLCILCLIVPFAVSLPLAAHARSTPTAPAASVTLTVHPNLPGVLLGGDFVGISLEANVLAFKALASGNFAQYLKTLGSAGVLRLGGNSSDNAFWTSRNERPPSWAGVTITPALLGQLAQVARASGWRVVLGVNLKHSDPTRAADEAAHAVTILGSSLLGIEIGNEPNYYESSMGTLWTSFESYRVAIKKAAPGVNLVGPDTARTAPTWLQDFASREQGHVDINYLSAHYYPACATDTPKTTIANLLSTTFHTNEQQRAQLVAGLAQNLKVPGLLDEVNSVSCSGLRGVSNTFASALWALDFGLLNAQAGINSLDFHSAIAPCSSASSYTPFCSPTAAAFAAGKMSAQPDYYGLLMLHTIGAGRFLGLDNSDLTHMRAYVLQSGGQLRLVLDNLGAASSVTIHLGASYTRGTALALTGPSLAATSGVTLGGVAVGSDGTFSGGRTTPVAVSGSTLTLNVAGTSALLVTLS